MLKIYSGKIEDAETKESILISDVMKTNLKIKPLRKKGLNVLLNSTANFLSNSLSNGNEMVDIYLELVLKNNS